MLGRQVVALALCGIATAAQAHGIAGNRFFTGTLTIDDPAVADEAILPAFIFDRPGTAGAENRVNWSFFRLLTPTLGVGIDSGFVRRDFGTATRSGFDQTAVGLKGEIYRNDLHETLVSTSLSWGIGRSGAAGVEASGPHTITPGLFFGRGFGDLPDSLALLRPFGVTGALAYEHPFGSTATNLGIDAATGRFGRLVTPAVDVLHWGFAVEFSTLYLTDRFTPGRLPKDEPLNQLLPLVEFAFDTPRGQKTSATINPGLSYVAVTWQLAVEAIVPLDGAAGHGVGGRAQLLFFLDDLVPSLFGKPLLGR